MSISKYVVFFTFSLLVHSLSYASQSLNTNKNFSIPKTQGDISIDAKLDEPQWQQAKHININIVTRPYDNTPSPISTEALLMEDGTTFYIAFIAKDPDPSQIRAFLKDRDRAWGNDLVGIKIDTYNEQRSAYRFMVNPLGVQIDGIENEVTNSESDSWDGIWHSAGEINEQGYIVEMALPLRMLNFNDKLKEQTWGIELVRFYPRNQNLRISNIQLVRGNNCEICQLAKVTGFKEAKQGSNLMITPSLVASSSETINEDDENLWDKDNDVEASLDLRWGITPDILLNATINPDFSTVESDNARLNINNNFALFNEEKRPFFLDNADYFDSNYNLVYTRNINAPNYGGKLTGRHNKHSFGVFFTDDTSTNILIPGNRKSSIATIDDESQASAFRYQNNYNEKITIGWISTLRTAQDYKNLVNGIDGRVRFNDEDVAKFQFLQSDTEYPDDLYQQFCDIDDQNDCEPPAEENDCDLYGCVYNESALRTLQTDSFKGHAYRISYEHTDSAWHYFAKYNEQNEGFRGDLGFISRVDFNKFVTGAQRRWYADDNSWWNDVSVYSDWDISHNDNGELLEKEFDINAQLRAKYESYFRLSYTDRKQVGSRKDKSDLAITGNTDLFNEKQWSFFSEVKPILGLYLNMNISGGDAIDYRNNRLGERQQLSTKVSWNINRHLEVKLKQTYRSLDAKNSQGINDNVFIARLTDFRATYQFNVMSFLRFSLIYNNTHRNPDNYLYIDPDDITARSKDLSSELLYAYKINPQTVFYLGYSSHHGTEEDFSNLEKDTHRGFLKFSYAWIK
ncbi:carbohydrate binding family 9 domain-containing protein [Litorilituus lipolyticus]|uniref:carbohydrate binding family 9 domain-containing protein n=1 Tax=Litorilituus lipolyticus TaxID=2491017 RepID=UPI001478F7FE|nr:carbohydrate binding family 9 domain-containing protein [Litorilituus lipolyticus]